MAEYDRNTQYGSLKEAVATAKKHRATPVSGGAKAMMVGMGMLAAAGVAAGSYALATRHSGPEVEYIAGQFVTKFVEEPTVSVESDGNVVTGIEEIDALNDSLEGEVYEQYVAHSEEHELDNIYVITVGEDVDLDKLMEEFAASPHIEYVEQSFYLTPDFEVPELTAEEIQAFEEQVANKEPNDHYYPLDESWDSPFGKHKALWGLYNTDAAGAWEITTGLPEIIAAVIDTGVDYNHVDIADRILRDEDGNIIGYDFVHKDDDPMDDHGHGTHVSGTIAATTNNGIGIAGVTWNGSIMPLKVCTRSGSCDWADVGRALVFAADNGAHVANISLGAKQKTPKALAEAIEYADSKGLIILTSAGNYNDDSKNWTPSNHPYVLSIAATTPDDEKATFSNWGDIVDVGAPGEQILSLLAKDNNVGRAPVIGGIYTVFRGTSMACPHAVGNVMLILSANPGLIGNREAVQAVMRAGVYDYATDPKTPAGTGIINYRLAVEEAKKFDAASDVPPHMERIAYLLRAMPTGYTLALDHRPHFNIGGLSKGQGLTAFVMHHDTPITGYLIAGVDGLPADGTVEEVIAAIADQEGNRSCELASDETPRELLRKVNTQYELTTEAGYRYFEEDKFAFEGILGEDEWNEIEEVCEDRWEPFNTHSELQDLLIELTDE